MKQSNGQEKALQKLNCQNESNSKSGIKIRLLNTDPNQQERKSYPFEAQMELQKQQQILPPEQPSKYCFPLIPITFSDTVGFESKCKQIRHLITFNNKKDIIQWIYKNNRENFGIQTNCQLLNNIQSDSFWKNIVISMMSDIVEYSIIIGSGGLRFSDHYQEGAMKINKFKCYIFLCQMFFGLIPLQQGCSQTLRLCTFAQYMNKEQRKIDQFSAKDIENIHKIKCLIFYFSILILPENQNIVNRQSITIERKKFSFGANQFYENLNHSKDQTWKQKFQMQEDYGPLGDESLVDIQIQSKFNSGQRSLTLSEISSSFQQDQGQMTEHNRILNRFLFSHPQAFIIKLTCLGIGSRQSISIIDCRKYCNCFYGNDNRLICQGRKQFEEQAKSTQQMERILLIRSRRNKFSIKNFNFNKIKTQMEKKYCQLKAAIKVMMKGSVLVPISATSKDSLILDFLIGWCTVSLIKTKCNFKFYIDDNFSQSREPDSKIVFNIQMIRKKLTDKQITDVMALIYSFKQYYAKIDQEESENSKRVDFLEFLKDFAF